uniref:Uncharacterized protein n=1 Tax=Panagrolaimus sp. PS1159 TaxID=55785 RepID=A0AC35FJ41_9BILA
MKRIILKENIQWEPSIISTTSTSNRYILAPSFSHYDTVSTQHHHQHQHQQNIIVAPNTSSSLSKIDIRHPPTIIKPKPLPMPRPYLKQGQLSLAPTMEDEHEDDESEIPQRSPAMFKRIRHKRKDRSASAHAAERNSANLSSLSLNQMDQQQSNIRHSVAVPAPPTNQEAVVRPQNFKEILNRFQISSFGFQRE